MSSFNLKNAVLKIKDGTGTPLELTVVMGEGNLTYSEKKPRIYLKNRGLLDDVEDGDDEPMEVSFEGRWSYLLSVSGEAMSIEDVLKKRGLASAWVSSDTDLCRPYAVDLELTHTPTCGDTLPEVILFPDFRYESLEHDAKGKTISCKGMCNATEPTITRPD
jgi:hypothetical protein